MKRILITEEQLSRIMGGNTDILNEVRNTVDNFALIGNLMNLTDPDKFFFVQIVKRWKDNKDKGMNRSTEFNYHGGGSMGTFSKNTAFKVHNAQELMALKPQIMAYCDANNARAYICCNPRSENAINNYLPTHLAKAARRNHGVVPDYEKNFGFEHLAGQPKNYDPVNFPDRLRFFLDIDCPENAFYIPQATKIHIGKGDRVDDVNFPKLRACPATYTDAHALILLPKYPNQEAEIRAMGGMNVWEETKNILAKHNIPIETEYKTPSKGLHVVIADISSIQNFAQVEQELRVFDDGKNVGRVQLVHANMDGKLILYSNVDTAGY